MKLWQILEKCEKELVKTFNGVDRKYRIRIDDDPWITITILENSKFNKESLSFDIRDWSKIKQTIEELMDKEI